jgi:hypothetical protein
MEILNWELPQNLQNLDFKKVLKKHEVFISSFVCRPSKII